MDGWLFPPLFLRGEAHFAKSRQQGLEGDGGQCAHHKAQHQHDRRIVERERRRDDHARTQQLADQRGAEVANLFEVNELIIRRMRTGVLLVDGDGEIRLANEAALLHLGAAGEGRRMLAMTTRSSRPAFALAFAPGDVLVFGQIGRASCRERVSSPV